MKRFIKKIIIYALFCLMVMVVPSRIIDPYNVFHWDQIRNNGVIPNNNYIKTKYIIHNPAKFDGFLFGSSRVGAIHVEKINSGSFYNMTYSSGTPGEHLETLKTFLNEGVNVRTVVMGIDSMSYTEDPETHYTQGYRAPYQYLTNDRTNFVRLYYDPAIVLQSVSTIMSDSEIEGFSSFYDYGWWCEYDKDSYMDWDDAQPSIGNADFMDETLEDIREMRDVCSANGIDFILFINPMHEVTYKASVEEHNFLLFLNKLAKITPYYNFCGENSITTDNSRYLDTSHYNAYVGDMIIDVIFNGKKFDTLYDQGFGCYVTDSNFHEFIDIIESGNS